MGTLAGLVLLIIGLVAFNQVRQGTLREWLAAKFLNAADPLRVDPADPTATPSGVSVSLVGLGGSPSGWLRPLDAPTISPWGVCRDGCSRRHEGTDIGGTGWKGRPVRAARGGVVRRTAGSGKCGLRVYVDHGDGWETLYCHLDAIYVSPGQRVSAGTPVGSCGNTGNAAGTPPHVHFEVHSPGGKINPETVIPAYTGGGRSAAGDRIPEGVDVMI